MSSTNPHYNAMHMEISSESLMRLNDSITVSPIAHDYTELAYTDTDGSVDTTVLSETELQEAIHHLSRVKQGSSSDSISYWELVQHQMSVWGHGNYWRFEYPNQKRTRTISRGYVVFLLQEILGCRIDRANSIAHQVMAEVLGLGSYSTSAARQITRYRENAAMQIQGCLDCHLAQGSLESTHTNILKIVLTNLFQAFQYVTNSFHHRKHDIPSIPREKIQRTLLKKSVNWLKRLANKICGHFFDKICPLAMSH